MNVLFYGIFFRFADKFACSRIPQNKLSYKLSFHNDRLHLPLVVIDTFTFSHKSFDIIIIIILYQMNMKEHACIISAHLPLLLPVVAEGRDAAWPEDPPG